MWSPLEQFDTLHFDCPKCSEATSEASLSHFLTPISWTNACSAKYSPRLIYGVNSNFLLLSRVYNCKYGHEVYGHHRFFVEHEDTISRVPLNYGTPQVLLWFSWIT